VRGDLPDERGKEKEVSVLPSFYSKEKLLDIIGQSVYSPDKLLIEVFYG